MVDSQQDSVTNQQEPEIDVKPPKEEEDKVRALTGLYEEASSAWSKERSAYRDYYRWWSGDHYNGINKASWQSKPSPNYIFATVETVVPILTDGLPRWNAEAKTENARKLADIADGVLNEVWDYNRMSLQLAKSVRAMQIYGTVYFWAWWDPDARDGLGEIIVQKVDPHCLLVDPSAENFDDANYVFYAENVSLGYIRRRWPEKGKFVKSGIMDKLLSRKRDPVAAGSADEIDEQTYVATSTDGSRSDVLEPGGEEDELRSYSVSKQATLVHAYVREKDSIKCYVFAGKVLLDSFDNQLGDRFPFAKILNCPKDGAWHGQSSIEQLISPQQIINTMLAQIIDNAKLTGNPMLVYAIQSGFDPSNFYAAPGVCVGVNGDPNSVEWKAVPAMDPKLFALVDVMRQTVDSVSGVHDVTQGKKPAGITAASAIAELQEAAQTRIREFFRQVAYGMEVLGEIVWDLAKVYYDRPRVLRVSDKVGDIQFVTMNEIVPDPITGQPVITNRIADDGEFNIRIDLGAGLPSSKIQKANLGLQMFQAGAIDAAALLDAADYPGRDEILQRLQQQRAQAQMGQQQSGAIQQGGSAPQGQELPAAMQDLQELIGQGVTE